MDIPYVVGLKLAHHNINTFALFIPRLHIIIVIISYAFYAINKYIFMCKNV